ncbi:MAG TPA: glycosyltransferase, partial [Lamprocystis sp. (in: g-proteobacteria)]|nr:glycosyltransferase [Lamprocystis sp. (in: g-proteobacteria)]
LSHQIATGLRHFHNRADATLVPTADLQAELIKAGFTQVHVFGQGVDVDLFAPTRRDERLRAAWGCGAGDLAVLYVGRMTVEMDLDLACEAFAAIAARDPGARFVLVGDGPELTGLARDHPGFICIGAKVNEELATHYASGDLLLCPSLAETFSNQIPEAMACALPVIAFDQAAAHAYIQSRVNGVTVQLGDHAGFIAAALDAAADFGHLRAMGEEARRTALDLSWERILNEVESLLWAVIRQRRAGKNPPTRAPTESSD